MTIRVKLLLILLAISIAPMLILRINARETLHQTGNELAEQARESLVRTAELELQRVVEDNAQVMERDGKLMRLALLYLVSRTEGVLAGSPDRDDPPALLGLPQEENSTDYCIRKSGGECLPLEVDMNASRIQIPMHGIDALKSKEILLNMTPAMHRIKRVLPHLVLWIKLRMKSGGLAVYPAFREDSFPTRQGMRKPGAHMEANFSQTADQGISWSYPYKDHLTEKVVFSLAAPFRAPDGSIAGNIMIDMPVNAMLHQNKSLRQRAPGTESLLIRLNHEKSQVEIIAEEDMQAPRHMRWVATQELALLASENSTQFDAFKIDLARRKSGVRTLPYNNSPSLWAYSPVGNGSFLLLVLPMKDIVVQADRAQEYVLGMMDDQLKNTGIILLLAIAGVVLLGILISGRFTSGIRIVSTAARRLAAGDFDVRCNIHRSDEIGDMGKAFDDMVPALQDRIRMKEDLDIAQEVQQNLLPHQAPRITGLDAAARVVYCDETGGDFYDYIPMGEANGFPECPGLAVAVGDVSGHGVPSALLMGSTRAFLRARRMMPGSAAEVVGTVNSLVARDTYNTGHFVTMFYVEVLPALHSIRYVRAGHDPALLIIPGKEKAVELMRGGPSLGLVENSSFAEQTVNDLPPGTILAIGTDGIWEARSSRGKMYGRERFINLIRAHAHESAQDITEAFYADHHLFRDNAPQEDDITLVVLKLA